ncbi:MAG TPA: alginate export family protein, partial [Candidatus Bathyarchaeia archaeon]|nr:alginate export family protein [Candidatus Bathyarchaeia archaeon]
YENQAGGKIYNTLFNATNSHTLGASLTMVPMEDVTANLYYDRVWLDKELPSGFALVQPDGTSTTPSQEVGETDLGDEVGLVLSYDYTEDVQLGARAGWFFPGNHYGNANINGAASQVILNAKVAF